MKDAVLFDLGNTLVRYYERDEFPEILKESIIRVGRYLAGAGGFDPEDAALWERVEGENYEAENCRVRPLEHRLARIFQLDTENAEVLLEASRRFMEPIFATGMLYEDTLKVLGGIGARGYRTAIVSNTPWGSPPILWQEELLRLGLIGEVEGIFFCRDIGWRKPSPMIFSYVLEQMMVTPRGSIFVGDDPRWDCIGPASVGIDTILVDRAARISIPGQPTIRSLTELLSILR